MRLLLDSHVVLWLLTDDRRLSASARALIGAASAECYVSAATWWELAIKQARDGSRLPLPLTEIRATTLYAGVRELSVTATHALRVTELPPLHRDPFDRMLIAQAMSEPMRLVTADAQVLAYQGVCAVLMDRASEGSNYSPIPVP